MRTDNTALLLKMNNVWGGAGSSGGAGGETGEGLKVPSLAPRLSPPTRPQLLEW